MAAAHEKKSTDPPPYPYIGRPALPHAQQPPVRQPLAFFWGLVFYRALLPAFLLRSPSFLTVPVACSWRCNVCAANWARAPAAASRENYSVTFFLRLQPLAVRVVSPRRTITLWAKSSRKDCELAMAEVYREYSFKYFWYNISVFISHQQSQFIIISDYMWKQQQNKKT